MKAGFILTLGAFICATYAAPTNSDHDIHHSAMSKGKPLDQFTFQQGIADRFKEGLKRHGPKIAYGLGQFGKFVLQGLLAPQPPLQYYHYEGESSMSPGRQ